ncbi:FecR family protein [Massilia alkalitolerans]|uniref:FecR family protein n=1 Tax=Massilia alkalitolerans TaxID=286638 RepID=UPI0004136B28|nr:FecR domain-containing protein [Massilia alkalitolerans]
MSTIDNEAFEWVARKLARGLSAPESAQFDAWYAADVRHQGAYVRAMAIYNAINLASAPQSLSPELSMARQQRRSRRAWFRMGAMAACLVAAVGTVSLQVLRDERVLTTAKGEFRKVPLQDKSVATINSGSQIEVAFTDKQRTVNLRKGEAWFEVAKDKTKPFVVEAGAARIKAVGTAFSVRRFANGTEVLVTEGKVEVWDKGSSARRRQLVEGDRAFLAQDASAISVSRQPVEVNRKLAWREGKVILKNQTLDDAVADFNRYSPKTIVIVDATLRDKRLFGQYKLDAPELFAQDVSTVLDVPVAITADTIFIGRRQGEAQDGI